MRQAPTYLIIGDGCMAQHTCHYFTLLGLTYYHWHYRTQSLKTLAAHLKQVSHILLLITDHAIEPFIQYHLTHVKQPQRIIHFSGNLVISNAIGAHPLQSFSRERHYSEAEYRAIPFVIEQHKPQVQDVLPGIPNPKFYIAPHKKPYYHALCVAANNFTHLLWQQFFSAMESEFSIPISHLLPYLHRSFENLTYFPNCTLTGPFARGDQSVLQSDLAALENTPLYEIFQAFIHSYGQKEQHEIH